MIPVGGMLRRIANERALQADPRLKNIPIGTDLARSDAESPRPKVNPVSPQPLRDTGLGIARAQRTGKPSLA